MKSKVYIYPIISFLLLLVSTSKKGANSEYEIYVLIALAFLSSIVAIIGFIQTIKRWKNNNIIFSILLLLINILFIISGMFWVLAYLTIGSYRALQDTLLWKFIRIYRSIIPPFI